MRYRKTIRAGWVVAAILLMGSIQVGAQPIRVGAAVQREIYVNEPFQFQVIIDGYEQAGMVDLTQLEDFSPASKGGRNQSSSMTSIINGQMTQSKTLRYIMAYQLTARSLGQMTIPSLTVEVEGKKHATNPITINVLKPGITDKIGLEMSISHTDCYVGQPVILTMTLYFEGKISYYFDIPVLRNKENFIVEDLPAKSNSGGQWLSITIDGSSVEALQTTKTYRGKKYSALIFKKLIIPSKAGILPIETSSVICRFVSNTFFVRRDSTPYIAEATGATLEVKALPNEGRPADFNGLVGRYTIETTANPGKVNVGDPITLTIMIGGELLRLVDMPDLAAMPEIADNFKVPTSPSAPKISGNRKIFTQTIRAIHDQVSEIPAIPLSYFDVDQGVYFTTYSDPIPLEVMATKVVTAGQALSSQVAIQASEIEAVRIGIAANYQGPELLENTAFSPMAAIAQPGYIVLWMGSLGLLVTSGLVRLLGQNSPDRQQARRKSRAGSQAIRFLKRMDGKSKSAAEKTADIMRRYIGDRYNKTAQSLTARDCRMILTENCTNQQIVDQFCALLEQCEQSQFAGGLSENDAINQREIIELIKTLDKQLK